MTIPEFGNRTGAAVDGYLGQMEVSGELLPGAAQLVRNLCLNRSPHTPEEALSMIADYLDKDKDKSDLDKGDGGKQLINIKSDGGKRFINPTFVPDPDPLKRIINRFSNLTEAGRESLWAQLAASTAGAPPGAMSAAVAHALAQEPALELLVDKSAYVEPFNVTTTRAALEHFRDAGLLAEGLDVDQLARDWRACGSSGNPYRAASAIMGRLSTPHYAERVAAGGRPPADARMHQLLRSIPSATGSTDPDTPGPDPVQARTPEALAALQGYRPDSCENIL